MTKRHLVLGAILSVSSVVASAAVFASVVPSSTALRSPSVDRAAERLQKRIERHFSITPSLSETKRAVEWQRVLSMRSVALRLTAEDGFVSTGAVLRLSDHPLWIRPVIRGSNFAYELDIASVSSGGLALIRERAAAPIDVHLTKVTRDSYGVERVEATGVARRGYDVPADLGLAGALMRGQSELSIVLLPRDGQLVNDTGENLGDLSVVGAGLSDFAGSGLGRKANVRKALSERLNNVIIRPGETFSFNKILGSVGLHSGWQNALVIINGKDLVPAPGGGICQVATTLYRSILQAGLPVLQRKNHSLFVTYYEKHGVGIDATVMPGQQDFTFRNDTAGPIIVQAENYGDKAEVTLYGTPDGRSTVLEGPFFQSTVPSELSLSLKRSEIAWVHRVTRTGEKDIETIVRSPYNSIPRLLPSKYPTAEIRMFSMEKGKDSSVAMRGSLEASVK